MTWKDSDEVTTTYGSIQRALEKAIQESWELGRKECEAEIIALLADYREAIELIKGENE